MATRFHRSVRCCVAVYWILNDAATAQTLSRTSQFIEAYRQSKSLAAKGQFSSAIKLLDRSVLDFTADPSENAANSRLLAYTAELLWKTAKNESDLFIAESYAAQAIEASRCEPTYWKTYVAIRLARETYAPFVTELESRKVLCYGRGELRRRNRPDCTIDWFGPKRFHFRTLFPDPTDSPLIEAVLFAQQGNIERTAKLLSAYKTYISTEADLSNSSAALEKLCPLDDFLAEHYLKLGKPATALAYVEAALQNSRSGLSAYRMYLRGVAQRMAGDIENARQSFTEALRIDDSLYDAEKELQAIAWGDSGDSQLQKSIVTAYLNRYPDSWPAWSALWDSQYLHLKSNVQEFAENARNKAKAPGLIAPKLAKGLVSLYLHDFADSMKSVEQASRVRQSSDVVFAALVLNLVSDHYQAAGQQLATLAVADPAASTRLLGIGVTSSELSELAASPQPLAQKKKAMILLRISDTFPGSAYAQTALTVLSRDLGQESASGRDIRVDVLWADREIQGQVAERRFELTRAQFAQLSATTTQLLSSQNILRADLAGTQANVVFQESQIRAMENLVRQTHVDLLASQSKLTTLIEAKDARIAKALDDLAGCTDAFHDSMQGQQLELDDLKNWKARSPQKVSQQVVTLADLFSRLSSSISVGFSLGVVNINVIGILAELARSLKL